MIGSIPQVRLFIAIELSRDLRESLRINIANLKSIVGSDEVRWVNPESIHLTLKFLGETAPDRTEEISRVLESIAAQHSGFAFHVGSFGCFPNWRKPNVFWVGVQEPSGELERLRNRIEDEFQDLGYSREGRAFKPHLTLGRLRKGRNLAKQLDLTNQLEKIQVDHVGIQKVSDFFLLRSELRPEGAIYTKLVKCELGKGV
jgi:2'-5' RNA ligase